MRGRDRAYAVNDSLIAPPLIAVGVAPTVASRSPQKPGSFIGTAAPELNWTDKLLVDGPIEVAGAPLPVFSVNR